jgi:acyl-CoA synthetase (AMP-forming)/AMP-acid ligase II
VLKGYWNAPEATAAVITEGGWLHTGDLVRRGLLGSVLFVGRAKDVIKRGGFSVYGREVQEVLEQHPDVAEAAVVGLSDEQLGEVPAAVVRLRPGADLDEAALAEWASARLAPYKVPVRYVAVDALPRTGTDKVQKARLQELF